MTRSNGHVHLDATMDLVPAECSAEERATHHVLARVPPQRGDLVVNQEAWERRGSRWTRCSTAVGCDPPRDRCDPVWTATIDDEVEPERRLDVLACRDGWLVADIDAVVTGCQEVDGATPPPGCAGTGTHRRWYGRWGDGRWRVVASAAGQGGCAEVEALVPAFPAALCRGLPPR